MKVKQFRHGDNLSYLLYRKNTALAIDGIAVQAILTFLEKERLKLSLIANTHNHFDHTGGNNVLLEKSQARLLYLDDLINWGEFDLENDKIKVYHTPGHSNDSICFHVGNFLITGDTLFNGTVGNCFTGDLKGFYNSIKKIMTLPGNTVIYAGHDYVRDSMAVAKNIEPDNVNIDNYMKHYDPSHVFSTLEDELRINPYLRFNNEKIIAFLKNRGMAADTEWQRWESLMAIP